MLDFESLKGTVIMGVSRKKGTIVYDDNRTVYVIWDGEGNRGRGYNKNDVVRHIKDYMKAMELIGIR